MEKYYDHRTGREYTRTETSLSSSNYLKTDSERLRLPKWVEFVDFYLAKFEREKQEAGK